MSKFACVCCGELMLDKPSDSYSYEICGNCGWEHCPMCYEKSGEIHRPNYISLDEAKEIVGLYGPGASTQINMARGLSRSKVESMSDSERATLKRLMDK